MKIAKKQCQKGVHFLAGTFSNLAVCQVFQKMAHFLSRQKWPLTTAKYPKWPWARTPENKVQNDVTFWIPLQRQNVGFLKGKNQENARYRKKVKISGNYQNGQNWHHLQNHDIILSTSWNLDDIQNHDIITISSISWYRDIVISWHDMKSWYRSKSWYFMIWQKEMKSPTIAKYTISPKGKYQGISNT